MSLLIVMRELAIRIAQRPGDTLSVVEGDAVSLSNGLREHRARGLSTIKHGAIHTQNIAFL